MAESNDSAQERTEAATPKRLEDARRRGQIPRSRELTTSLLMLAGAGGMLALGPSLGGHLAAQMRAAFTMQPLHDGVAVILPDVFMAAIGDALIAVAPFLALCAVVAMLGPLALGGLTFSGEALAPKWDRLDPVSGLKRVFSAKGLMELLKALAKFALVTGTAVMVLWLVRNEVVGLAGAAPESGLRDGLTMLAWMFLVLGASTVLVAAVDVPFQVWNHARELKMSRQDIKDEMKETEGRPEVKGRMRAMARELANRRMMQDVPTADVVVTNPTHFAVALRYDAARMQAPRVVAKGSDAVAARIREVAVAHGVAVVSAPPLARSLYRHARLGREIPIGLYRAVAELLAYVYRVRRAGEGTVPAAYDIPESLQVASAEADPTVES